MAQTEQTMPTGTTTLTVSEQLEAAWLFGEMSHTEACGWMAEYDGFDEGY